MITNPAPGAVPKKVVLTLIEKDGRFVLINRVKHHLGLSWAFPGGVTEDKETDEQTAVREAREEVGMDVEVVKKLLERKHPNTFVETVYFHCHPKDTSAEPVNGEDYEISEVKWVPAGEVLSYFTSDVHPTIKNFLAGF